MAPDGIFISYRREGGAEMAQMFKEFLEGQGFRVFLDVSGLSNGKFDSQILAHIEGHAHLLLVCSKGCLDRCNDEADWIRMEVAHALKLKRNVVPVTLPGFVWPDRAALPEEMRDLSAHNAFVYSHDHWEDIKHKLARQFGASKFPKGDSGRSDQVDRFVQEFLPAILKAVKARESGPRSLDGESALFEAAATEVLKCPPGVARETLEAIVQKPKSFAESVARLTADQPQGVKDAARVYFTQLPGTLQNSLRRSSDRSGRTIPSDMPLSKPGDLFKLIPNAMPRFEIGQFPVPGTDLKLIDMLGRGGFGEVWRARHINRPLAKDVVLKFCINERAARSLKKEVDLLERIKSKGRHPNIVELLDTHLSCNPPCLEYELVEGGDFAGWLDQLSKDPRRRGLTPTKIAMIMARITAAVGRAHQHGIVHRDLKPQNVMVVRGSPTEVSKVDFKITDFGIGGVIRTEELKENQTAMAAGAETLSRGTFTPIYASPQQQHGAAPDKRDDVFALGVIWYQILIDDLTKEAPRGGGWKNRLKMIGVTDEMLTVLEGCIESEVDDRLADAEVLGKRLNALAELKPETPSPPPVSPSSLSLEWAEVLEKHPDPAVVTGTFIERILATGLPWRVRDRATGIEMLLVPSGRFSMGSGADDPSARPDETRCHWVSLSRPFYLGRYPVTQAEWGRMDRDNPSDSKGQRLPVERIRWDDATRYCQKAGLRLPTEAEWEFACRAGSTAPRYGELELIAWHSGNSQKRSRKVGLKQANALGFSDMIGLVWEWCSDHYTSDYYDSCSPEIVDPKGPTDVGPHLPHVQRGGSFGNREVKCRAASRSGQKSNHRVKYNGFRVARDPAAPARSSPEFPPSVGPQPPAPIPELPSSVGPQPPKPMPPAEGFGSAPSSRKLRTRRGAKPMPPEEGCGIVAVNDSRDGAGGAKPMPPEEGCGCALGVLLLLILGWFLIKEIAEWFG